MAKTLAQELMQDVMEQAAQNGYKPKDESRLRELCREWAYDIERGEADYAEAKIALVSDDDGEIWTEN